jgi:chromosome segregation ATPase
VQALHLVLICSAALAGALIGAVACRWHLRQRLAQLQQRLARSEEARNGAIERSAQAREQIAQLSKAIADLRKTHQPVRAARPPVPTIEERRAMAERALADATAADGNTEQSLQSGKVILFANTQPMEL